MVFLKFLPSESFQQGSTFRRPPHATQVILGISGCHSSLIPLHTPGVPLSTHTQPATPATNRISQPELSDSGTGRAHTCIVPVAVSHRHRVQSRYCGKSVKSVIHNTVNPEREKRVAGRRIHTFCPARHVPRVGGADMERALTWYGWSSGGRAV